ncbi:4-hydroxy-tetrahydrodipicolinate synthase [Palleronia aestuarii]|uniref:4-hydroxy-tetrahydrodipicolinate synthase n=1 Tax=Palleronia aestuarii TaxID=568105 RepID=A0A2W7P900_9RHOB|nr:dihydrodipicolinate synthase family protein [Palleronia aestuarii]PZX19842.1 4-hydroxy-tetrahydrodipicolinate synthase [Palleronia aestuarii]
MPLFHGLSAFPLTPTDMDGRVDTDSLRRILDRLVAAEVHSVGLLGSTGGYAYLDRAERRRAVEAAAGHLAGRVPLVVGVGALRTDAAMALAQDARAAGADGLLLAPVSYTPLTEDEVFVHVRAVAEAGGLPLCLYNNPSTTHFIFTTELIARLAALDEIVAIKMPLPAGRTIADEIVELRGRVPDGFAIGYSGDWGCAEALLEGADAWFSVLGGLFPRTSMRIVAAARDGDAATVHEIDARLGSTWDLFRQHGSLRVVYAMARMLDLTKAEPPRPILPLPTEEEPRIRAAMAEIDELEGKAKSAIGE